MPPTHVLSIPAPPSAPVPRRVPRALPASPAFPALTRRASPSVASGLILALIVLALLLQASFFVGLATGQVGGPEAMPAPRAAVAR